MSSFELISDNKSKYLIKFLRNNSKKKANTSTETFKKQKTKKININKFLTRALYFEHKKNLNIEKLRFKQILKEQNSLEEKQYLTGRSLESNKKNQFFKKAIDSINIKKKKIFEIKRNNTIEGIKTNKLLKDAISNKYKKKNKRPIKINKFNGCEKKNLNNYLTKEKNTKLIHGNEKKEKIKSKNNLINFKKLYKIF